MSLSRAHAFALGFLAAFAAISVLVVTGVTAAWDVNVLQSLASLRTPTLNSIMRGASWLGD
jgi:predicted glycosyltransferase